MKSSHPLADYPDIHRKINHRSSRILLLSALWIAAVTAVELVFLHNYFLAHSVPPFAAAVIWLVLYLIGLLKIELFPWLFDLPWEGTLIRVKYHSPGALPTSTANDENNEILTIRTAEGKTFRRCIPRDPKLDAVIYREGDLVRYYRGTKYPLILKREGAPAPWLCVFCSNVQPYPGRTHCDHCGMSLIAIPKNTP